MQFYGLLSLFLFVGGRMGARLFRTQSLGFSKIFLFAKDLSFKSFGNS